jgi:uncharacterized spore protein YtfJ
MDLSRLMPAAREGIGVRRVFGEPVDRDGTTLSPAATVIGGAGSGGGEEPGSESEGEGRSGGGSGFFGVMWPSGAYVIKDGHVGWRPAFNVTQVMVVLVPVALGLAGILRRRSS